MIRGFIEVVGALQVRGWALRTGAPEDAVEVVATAAGAHVASGFADVVRTDLSAAGFGGGRHGFILNLERSLSVEEQAALAVEVVDEEGRSVLLPKLRASDGARDAAGSPAADMTAHRHEIEDRAQWPVFILGAARSGTSALAQGLLGTTRYKGQEEGHLLDLVHELARTVGSHYASRGEEWSKRPTMIASVPEAFFQNGLRGIFVDLARRLFPGGRWLDKTPRVSMITAASALRDIWPSARFIYLRRRGLENIRSRQVKFPTIPFEAHCLDWRRSLAEWMRVRASMDGSALEIDQLLLAREPDRVASEIGALIDLSDDERVRLADALRNERPERSSQRIDLPVSIEALDWTNEQRNMFEAICGDIMRSYGYASTRRYFLEGAAATALRHH